MGAAAFAVKHAFAHLAQTLGVLTALRERALRGKAVVLMYHRVVASLERDQVLSHAGMTVDARTFAMQVRCLKQRFSVVTLQEFLERLSGRGTFPDGSCLITFDDGWRDNYLNAVPILEENGVPATVFLTTGYVGTTRRFWQERLAHLLVDAQRQAGTAAGRRFADVLERGSIPGLARLRGPARKRAVDQIVAGRKRFSEEQNESLIAELADALGATGEQRPPAFITWDEARAMHGRGVSFGSHGESHRLLTTLAPEEAQREISRSKSALEAHLGVTPRVFSYPNGDLNAALAAQVHAGGYEAAFGTREGFAGPASDPFALPRVNIADGMTSCEPLFLSRLSGVL